MANFRPLIYYVANADIFDRMLGDVHYLQDNLSGLRHMGGQSGMLETIVEEKAVGGIAPSSKGGNSKSRLSAKMAAVVANVGGKDGYNNTSPHEGTMMSSTTNSSSRTRESGPGPEAEIPPG